MSSEGINVLAVVKGAERYVVVFDDSSTPEALRTVGRWASTPGKNPRRATNGRQTKEIHSRADLVAIERAAT